MPQAKRFQSQLSALINFLKYEENKARLLNEALVVMENASDNYTKMQHQLAEARAAHSRGMTERTKVKAEVKQVRERPFLQSKTWQLVCFGRMFSNCSLHHLDLHR